MSGIDFMDTFFVPFKVVYCPETLLPIAAGFLAPEALLMSHDVFSVPPRPVVSI
jgi:hypothetical protein